MRRDIPWLAALAVLATGSAPAHAATLVAKPRKPGFWAGTRLQLVAERAPAGRLRIHVEGMVAAARPARAVLYAEGCSAGTDNVSSYSWSPERHPDGRQAVPASPAYQQSGARFALRLRGTRRVSYSATVGYGYRDARAPVWTDCVTLGLARRGRNGADTQPAFDPQVMTLYVTVQLQDGRHVPCGPAPAFCLARRPSQFLPPALPDFPPAPGYPGSPGVGEPPGDVGANYPYHVCPAGGGRFVLCSAAQAAGAAA